MKCVYSTGGRNLKPVHSKSDLVWPGIEPKHSRRKGSDEPPDPCHSRKKWGKSSGPVSKLEALHFIAHSAGTGHASLNDGDTF